ncbi:hypothetical protein KAF25_003032 [Fusarium avenaceum]|uniref:Ankyrin repeat protein n=1 Tax=Fusarium avenaceum TaxID=40199 RepID=A0A9P7H0Y6_9HYPO|nr:hypothetical protein KAF25_003032 [Fusarium avenaceum]
MIEYFILQAKEQTDLMMPAQRLVRSTAEHPLVSFTTQELEEILEELSEIVDKYSCSTKFHDPKRFTNKVKWFSEASKIEELHQRAQATKSNLHMAITFRVSSMVDRGNVRQEVLFHRVTQQLTYYTQETRNAVQNLPQTQEESRSITEEEKTKISSLPLKRAGEDGVVAIEEESLISVRAIRPLGSRRCGACHKSQLKPRSTWPRSLLGSWLVRYKNPRSSCQGTCGSDPGVEFEYYLPKWLWSGILSFQAYRGQAINCALRPARKLTLSGDIWQTMKCPHVLQNRLRKGYVYFPDDTVELGIGLLTLAVMGDSPESIEILLKLWENILPCQGLPKQTGHYIEKYRSKSGSRLNMAIGKVMAFVNDWDDVGLTQLHIAAAKGDVLPVLREEPWAIEQFDENGWPPIHFAVVNNNFEGLEQLIQAGADINQRDAFGCTPLMASALDGHELMVQKLLEYNECRRWIDKVGDEDQTALHCAIERSWPKCVWLLLDAGASTSKLVSPYRTYLHILAYSHDSKPEAAVEIFHHLRSRGLNLEARDENGLTPILTAIWSGNVTVFNTLISAGASLNVSSSNRQNVLWTAARAEDYRIINHLAKQNLENIDPQLVDIINGMTALGNLCRSLADPYPIAVGGPPNLDQQQAFIRLYFKLLIRDLKRLMSILKEVCSAAAEKDAGATTALLDILIKKNETSFRHEQASWYRGLQIYVKDGKWNPLVEAICEEYDETSEKLERAHIAKEKTIEEPEMGEFFYA